MTVATHARTLLQGRAQCIAPVTQEGMNMWAINAPSPEFCVRTPQGLLGPGDLLGSWAVLLHCSRPCVPGCSVCIERFTQLGARLADRGLRLVVALDGPDSQLDSVLKRRPAQAPGSLVVGAWQAPVPAAGAATTLFAVIDPNGFVRALTEVPNVAPLAEAVLMDSVDRVLGRSPGDSSTAPAAATGDAYGCVGWYDYGADAKGQG
jgi:hypothetical protein